MTDTHPRVGARAALRLISLYQAARAGRPTACRFATSCSTYAAEAVRTHGLVRGAGLAVRRFARCRPFGPVGVDEVPPVRARTAT